MTSVVDQVVPSIVTRPVLSIFAAAALATGCLGGTPPSAIAPSTVSAPVMTVAPTQPMAAAAPTMTFPADIFDFDDSKPLAPGTYFIDPDVDPATQLRVEYTIPADGWRQWIGGYFPGNSRAQVLFSITAVTNLLVDACTNQVPRVPAVGESVHDLVTALAALPPFEVVVAPRPVEIAGYRATYLELELPLLGPADNPFRRCAKQSRPLASWMAPSLPYAFDGYWSPGQREGFWIFDARGTRLVVEATWLPNAPDALMTQLHQAIDSIRVLP